MQELWREMHAELTQQSRNAQQILVETSGHFLQRERPEIVAGAILQMLRTINGPTS